MFFHILKKPRVLFYPPYGKILVVLVEAAFCKVPIFSSDAETGPSELIRNNINGTIFKNNNKKVLSNFDNYLRNSNNKKMILNNLKESRNFSIFNHYKKLNIFLN